MGGVLIDESSVPALRKLLQRRNIVGPRRRHRRRWPVGGGGCARKFWSLKTEATGTLSNDGSFELICRLPSEDEEDTEIVIEVSWNESAESLQTKINEISGVADYVVSGSSINKKNLMITGGNGAISDFDIGVNDLLSGRPYLDHEYKAPTT